MEKNIVKRSRTFSREGFEDEVCVVDAGFMILDRAVDGAEGESGS